MFELTYCWGGWSSCFFISAVLVRNTSKTGLALVGFFVPLRYHLDDSVKRRSCIIFLYQSRFASKLSPAGAASLLRSLYRQRKHRKRRNRNQQNSAFFVDFERPVLEGDLVTFWRRLYVDWSAQ
jgi:7-keto-8-aminopelargonate synthetase-like enzyme